MILTTDDDDFRCRPSVVRVVFVIGDVTKATEEEIIFSSPLRFSQQKDQKGMTNATLTSHPSPSHLTSLPLSS